MIINTNVSALNALGNLNKVENAVSSSMEKLSSGFRINKAGDDAAGLGIANQLDSDVMAMQQTSRNAEQAGSVLQIMDGATSNLQTILERMKELAAQSSSDTVDSDARTKIDNEFGSLTSELDRIVATTKFQGASLLDGTFGSKISVGVKSLADGSSFDTGVATGVTNTSVIPTSGAATYATITSDVTATVASSNAAATQVGSVAGSTVAVIPSTGQATLDSLTGSSIAVSSTFLQSDVASASGSTGLIGAGSPVTAAAVGTAGTVQALAAGTYSIKETGAAASGAVTLGLYLNGASSPVDTTSFADNATSFALGGINFTVAGSTAATAFDGSPARTDITVGQEYTVGLTGANSGGAVTQSQVITDTGVNAAPTDFSSFGLSVVGPTGSLASLDSTTIGLTSTSSMTLTGSNANGAVTQTLALNSNPASQQLDFSNFGLRVNLGASATAGTLKTAITGGADTIQQQATHQAQFLVSSSQSYTGNDLINLDAIDLSATTLGVNRSAVDLTTATGAQAAMTTIDTAIQKVGDAIGSIGASENRIQYADQNVTTAIQNFTAAESTIKDVDMASEMTEFSKNQILAQAGTAMLAQANQMGASVLKLLQ